MTPVRPRISLTLCLALLALSLFTAPQGLASDQDCEVCCCLGSLANAQDYAARVARLVPGVDTNIRTEQISSPKGRSTVYSIFVSHPGMSMEEICSKLADEASPCDTQSQPQ